MKILQVTPRYAPNTGGVETHVQAVSERLVERGHDVTVLTADAGSGESPEVRKGVRVERHRAFAVQGAFHVAPTVAPAVRRANADVVHAHNYHSLPLFFAALGVTDERFVVTAHYHGASASALRDRLLSLYRPFGRWPLQRADAVLAVSEWEREKLRGDFGVDATVVPNGLAVERFADANPHVRDSPYLLCVGRLEEYKGIQHVIRGLGELPEYDLVVAGDGPYRGELERIARREGIGDRVDFLGFVDGERLPSLYAGADAFLTLSEFEAYGMTVAEALAAGTPCVVYDHGALGDWTSTVGCVGVAGRSPHELRAAIDRAREAEPDSESPWTWDEVVGELEERYRAD